MEEDVIDLKELFLSLWDKKIVIIIVEIVFLLLGSLYTFGLRGNTSEYTVSNQYIVSLDASLTNDASLLTESASNAVYSLTTSEATINSAINHLNLESDSFTYKDLEIEAEQETGVISLTITSDATSSNNLDHLMDEIQDIVLAQIKESYSYIIVNVTDTLLVENTISMVSHLMYMIIFIVIGFILAVGGLIVQFLLDDTVRKPETIENMGLKVLATVPKGSSKSELITNSQPNNVISEAIKNLSVSIQYNSKDSDTFLITSPLEGEGKTFVASNLAISFVQKGKKILLIDGNLRKGDIAQLFNLPKAPGLSDYLINDDENIDDLIKETEIAQLSIITAGNNSLYPSELLLSDKFIKLIEDMKERYDVVLIDGPSLVVSDAIILSKAVDHTIMVASCKETGKDDLKKAIKVIDNVNGNILGVLLNKVSGKYNKKVKRNLTSYDVKMTTK